MPSLTPTTHASREAGDESSDALELLSADHERVRRLFENYSELVTAEADGVVDGVGRGGAATAQRNHGHANAARVDVDCLAFSVRENIPNDGRGRQIVVHPLDEVAWSAEFSNHASEALGCAATIERVFDQLAGSGGSPSVATQ